MILPPGMAKKDKPPQGAKAAFVRNHPNLKAQEIVELAKQQGITLTVGHVYNIRATDKAKQAKEQGGKAPNGRTRPAGEGSSLDAQLRTLIIRIGLDRAEQIFGDLKSRLSRID